MASALLRTVPRLSAAVPADVHRGVSSQGAAHTANRQRGWMTHLFSQSAQRMREKPNQSARLEPRCATLSSVHTARMLRITAARQHIKHVPPALSFGVKRSRHHGGSTRTDIAATGSSSSCGAASQGFATKLLRNRDGLHG